MKQKLCKIVYLIVFFISCFGYHAGRANNVHFFSYVSVNKALKQNSVHLNKYDSIARLPEFGFKRKKKVRGLSRVLLQIRSEVFIRLPVVDYFVFHPRSFYIFRFISANGKRGPPMPIC
jgi:hypothetical protein